MKLPLSLLKRLLVGVFDKLRGRDVLRFVVGLVEGETGKTVDRKLDRDSLAYQQGHFLGKNAPGTVVAFLLGVALAGGACLFVL